MKTSLNKQSSDNNDNDKLGKKGKSVVVTGHGSP
jgi:hypothetical protein